MTTGTRKVAATLLMGLGLISGCGRPLTGPSGAEATASGLPGFASADPSAAASSSSSGDFKVTVMEASYGTIAVTTTPGSICLVQLSVNYGYYGERPPSLLPQLTAGATGVVRWTYAAPRVPKDAASYTVTCHKETLTGTAFGSFDITPAPMKATTISARVTVESPPHLNLNPDPSLVPLRDAAVAKMKATLASEWRSATRGLGGLTLVDEGSDISISVVAARGTSVHRQNESDDSQDIIVYVSDRFGPQSVENLVATALHELGHIWCCYGPGTFPAGTDEQGHWLTKERSPGLYGVDKYGLMTDPVTCVNFATVVSCPNRFSDREMTALGFATFPAPAVDPCITQALSLNSSLNALKPQIDAQSATLTSLDAQIKAIKTQYPNGNYPPSVAATYNSLVDQYNPLVAPYNANLTTYNSQLQKLNALPCDAS